MLLSIKMQVSRVFLDGRKNYRDFFADQLVLPENQNQKM
jgi:hypothetical protein